MTEIDNTATEVLSMPVDYARLTPIDAEAILGAGGEHLFTCSYNKLTRDTHPKLIEKLTNKAKVAEKEGLDFSPIFVSQLRHMTLVLDIYRDDTIVDDIIKPYIDDAYPERLSVVYKAEFQISKNEVVAVDLGPSHMEKPLVILYIIHPVTSLSELYLPNSFLGTLSGAYSNNLEKEDYDWMGLADKDVSARMTGMTPPFCGTEAHRQIVAIFQPLLHSAGINIEEPLESISSVVDVRHGGTSVLSTVKSTAKDMYTKKLCITCPNALLCMASGLEPVNPAAFNVTEDDSTVIYNAHVIQQTCIETYFRELMSKLGLNSKMMSKKMLLMQEKIDFAGTGCGEGYATQHFINIVAGICRNASKSVEWLQSKVKADGMSWAHMSDKQSYGQRIKQPISRVASPSLIPYHKTTLSQGAKETKLLPGLDLTHSDYYPGRYDKRNVRQELRPAVLPLKSGGMKEAVSIVVKGLLANSKSTYGKKLSKDMIKLPDLDTLTDLIMQVLQPLVTTEDGKSYLEVSTAFVNETAFQGIHKTMLEIKRLIKANNRLFPLALKEYTYVQTNAEIKLSSAVCEAFSKISHNRYGSSSKCKHALTCRHADDNEIEGCGLCGLKTSEWASHYGFINKKGKSLMPCTGPITDQTPLLTQGPDVIYAKLCQKFPLLDNSLVVLAAHLERVRKRNISAGGALHHGLNPLFCPTSRGGSDNATRGAAIRAFSLYITGNTVYPVVMSPYACLQRDVDRCEEEQLYRLKAFVPQEGESTVKQAYMEALTGRHVRVSGDSDDSIHAPLLWIPTNVSINNTAPEVSQLLNEEPVYNLRTVAAYNQDVEMLSPSQLLIYEQLKLRVIPVLAPKAYPNLLINGGNYENGTLQIVHSTVKASEDKLHRKYELQVGVPQVSLFTVITAGQAHSMSHNIAADIREMVKNRKALMPFENKTIIAKDSRIHAFETKSNVEGEVLSVGAVKYMHGGADMASHSGADYVAYSSTGCALKEGWDDKLITIPELTPVVNSRSKETQKEIRRQLYRADYELLLSNYWIVNGIQTSALGVNALIIGSAATIPAGVVPESMVK